MRPADWSLPSLAGLPDELLIDVVKAGVDAGAPIEACDYPQARKNLLAPFTAHRKLYEIAKDEMLKVNTISLDFSNDEYYSIQAVGNPGSRSFGKPKEIVHRQKGPLSDQLCSIRYLEVKVEVSLYGQRFDEVATDWIFVHGQANASIVGASLHAFPMLQTMDIVAGNQGNVMPGGPVSLALQGYYHHGRHHLGGCPHYEDLRNLEMKLGMLKVLLIAAEMRSVSPKPLRKTVTSAQDHSNTSPARAFDGASFASSLPLEGKYDSPVSLTLAGEVRLALMWCKALGFPKTAMEENDDVVDDIPGEALFAAYASEVGKTDLEEVTEMLKTPRAVVHFP